MCPAAVHSGRRGVLEERALIIEVATSPKGSSKATLLTHAKTPYRLTDQLAFVNRWEAVLGDPYEEVFKTLRSRRFLRGFETSRQAEDALRYVLCCR